MVSRAIVRLVRYFNSIKVQLKPKQIIKEEALTRFQFHKGTIKTGGELGTPDWFPNFNSIKVQLKLINFPNAVDATSFQFHKGTIKTHLNTD